MSSIGPLCSVIRSRGEARANWETDPDYRERRDDEGTAYLLSGCMSAQTSADLPPDHAKRRAESGLPLMFRARSQFVTVDVRSWSADFVISPPSCEGVRSTSSIQAHLLPVCCQGLVVE